MIWGIAAAVWLLGVVICTAIGAAGGSWQTGALLGLVLGPVLGLVAVVIAVSDGTTRATAPGRPPNGAW